jgi:hypothetical protein
MAGNSTAFHPALVVVSLNAGRKASEVPHAPRESGVEAARLAVEEGITAQLLIPTAEATVPKGKGTKEPAGPEPAALPAHARR